MFVKNNDFNFKVIKVLKDKVMSIVPLEPQDGEFLLTKKYIVTKLGNPFLSVQLTEEMLNVAISDALEMWYFYKSSSMHHMVLDYWIFETSPNQATYMLDKCVDPQKVKGVIYNPQNYSLFNIAFNQNFDFLFFTTSEQTPDLATFYFALMKQEFVNKVLGQQGTYDIIGSPPRLHLMPVPQGTIDAAVIYSKLPDVNTLDRIGWIRRYSLASAKEILGEILTRFSNLPSGMGDLQMNGDVLKSESQREKEQMMEELRQTTDVYAIRTDYDGPA